MQKRFRFLNTEYALEIQRPPEVDGEFKKCQVIVRFDAKGHPGVFKLTKPAWDTVTKKAQEQKRPLEDVLAEGGIAVLKAELYIRTIPVGFEYVVDHRYFEDL